MNKLTIIGNLTRDPETNTTNNGKEVCNFTVAVSRRKTQQNQEPEADFFRVAAWNELGKICKQYLEKGRKVCVVGPVSVSTYTAQDGTTRASMNVIATDVEFLSPKSENNAETHAQTPAQADHSSVDTDEMPF